MAFKEENEERNWLTREFWNYLEATKYEVPGFDYNKFYITIQMRKVMWCFWRWQRNWERQSCLIWQIYLRDMGREWLRETQEETEQLNFENIMEFIDYNLLQEGYITNNKLSWYIENWFIRNLVFYVIFS